MSDITVADPSIYNNVFSPDPMAGVNLQDKYLGIQHGIQQNKLTQQDLDFRQGLADAEAASLKEDGTQDTTKFNKLIMSNPKTAWKAQELLQQGVDLNAPQEYTDTSGKSPVRRAVSAQDFRTMMNNSNMPSNSLSPQQSPSQSQVTQPQNPNAPQQNKMGQMQAAYTKIDALNGAATDLANNPNPTRQDAISHMGNLIANKTVSPQEMIQIMSDPNDPLPNNPKDIQSWGMRHANITGAALQQFKQVMQQHAEQQGMQPPSQQPQQGMPQDPTQQSEMPQQLQPQQPQNQGGPGITMGVPEDYKPRLDAAQKRIDQINTDAQTSAKLYPILGQIEDLSKAGAHTGDATSKIYKSLSDKGLISPTSDTVIQAQEIAKYMEQALLAGGAPGSDKQLESLHAANANPELLPGAIQNIVPFLKAASQGNILKQQYYNKVLDGSSNPDKEAQAAQNWNQNFDQRLIEFNNLKTDEQKAQYVETHPGLRELLPKWKNLKAMGVIQ